MHENETDYDFNLNEADYLLRECVNAIKGSVDQIYYGLFKNLSRKDQKYFLTYLKSSSDSLHDVLYKSIVEKADKINHLNNELKATNSEINLLKEELELRVKKRTKEIKEIQHITIFALARLAESRDKDTGNHLNKMRMLCYLITKELAKTPEYKDYIDERYINNIYHSSPLHDIGKVGISDDILLKPSKLTPEEFIIMKSHTLIGGRTLEDAELQLKYKSKSFLSMGKHIAYYHHEKWDGSGYPFGLKGKHIPLSARIVAVSDVYDALISKRVYKAPIPHENAISEIIKESGTHFDPLIVESFLKIDYSKIND
jgi:putative two-component system response regulator